MDEKQIELQVVPVAKILDDEDVQDLDGEELIASSTPKSSSHSISPKGKLKLEIENSDIETSTVKVKRTLCNSSAAYFCNRISALKSIDKMYEEHEASEMKKTLGLKELVALGIGQIIGTGIFVLTGTVAATNSGPAIVLSFLIAGLTSLFAALCYAELASVIPIAGSAYTYSYATMGEFVAWTIGWDLILEYLIGASTVAVGWSAYLDTFLDSMGLKFPSKWASSPVIYDVDTGKFEKSGAIMNLPAFAISLVITLILVRGIQESAFVNNIIVVLKITVVLLFVIVMASEVKTSNWDPFIPQNQGTFGKYGVSGIFQGATSVFFSYIGFDSLSTCAQECKNPQRDLPLGTLISLLVCTILYVVVSLILTGIAPYESLNVANPISYAVELVDEENENNKYAWLTFIISIGALAGLTSVILVSLLGQPRIFYSMAVDGLFPKFATWIHPRYKTPYVTTLISGICCAIISALAPIDVLAELTSIGTLFAFVLVCLGVMILRLRRPDLKRAFKVPFGPYLIPLLGAFSSGALVCTATVPTILRLIIWMCLGWILYFCYGYYHSVLNGVSINTFSVIDLKEK